MSPIFPTLRCRVYADRTGAWTEVQAVLTPHGWLLPLLEYCLANAHRRSPAWIIKLNRSVVLFLAYLLTHPSETDSYKLFQNFAQRLYTGTFDRETGLDPSWLCWRPMSAKEAARVISLLNGWFDWLGETRPPLAQVNPRYLGSPFDRAIDEAAYRYRRDHAFLGHTWKVHPEKEQGHLIRAQRPPKKEKSVPPAFPEERFFDLISQGFVVGGKPNYRDILITLLLNGAGFRYSEPFHLYLEDVIPDPNNPKQAIVHIHHPSQGKAPEDPTWRDERGRQRQGKRATYLSEKFGLAPRHLLINSQGAGWKGGIHEGEVGDCYKRAYWFPQGFGELFLTIWKRYLEQVARAGPRPHPFAFINFNQNACEMYCKLQYWRAHARACERIGLIVGKEMGTTPHAHRHAYGRRLVRGGLLREDRRRFLHHADLDSQDVYTSSTSNELLEALNSAAEKLNQRFRLDI